MNELVGGAFTGRACKNCAHFFAEGDGGHCRRYPPHPLLAPQQNALRQVSMGLSGCFPPVDPNTWCGEFTPRPATMN